MRKNENKKDNLFILIILSMFLNNI